MILYHYRCTCCANEFEVQQSIKDKPLSQCNACQQFMLERVIHGGTAVFIQQEPTTVGQVAKRNSKKFGKYGVEDRDRKHKLDQIAAKQELRERAANRGINIPEIPENRPDPWYGKPDIEKINKMTPEQQQRFIMEGR
jgi:putative FmdB family regulatory protein